MKRVNIHEDQIHQSIQSGKTTYEPVIRQKCKPRPDDWKTESQWKQKQSSLSVWSL